MIEKLKHVYGIVSEDTKGNYNPSITEVIEKINEIIEVLNKLENETNPKARS